jgi:hypothetical protein
VTDGDSVSSNVEAGPDGSASAASLRPGMFLELRKPHACGANRWKLVRLGADVGLDCTRCGRRIMIARADLQTRLRRIVETNEP